MGLQGVWSAHTQFSDWPMVRFQGSATGVTNINLYVPVGLVAIYLLMVLK